MSPDHDEQSLAAAYVLGALEEPERRAFETHLAGCPACAGEVGSLGGVARALAMSVPQRTPPPALRARILGAVTGVTPIAPPRPMPAHTVRWLPLAAAVVLAAGLGVYSLQLRGRVSTLEARLGNAERRAAAAERGTLEARRVADDAQMAMTILAAPDLARIDLAGQPRAPQASARALWSRSRGMVFTAANLPAAPEGRIYQVWVVTAQAPVSAGLLTLDPSGRAVAVFQTPSNIAPPTAVAVTLEPAGGVPAPTGQMYLLGTPSI